MVWKAFTFIGKVIDDYAVTVLFNQRQSLMTFQAMKVFVQECIDSNVFFGGMRFKI